MQDREILFYDVEVFRFDSLVVFKNIDNQIVNYFWSHELTEEGNGFEKVREVVDGKILCGYNNHHYDDKILTKMMQGVPQKGIKAANDKIINGSDDGIKVDLQGAVQSIDCMQQIDLSMPGLKLIEGNMGKSIIESDVSFDLDRPLTAEEKEEVLKYCYYDVENTIEVYKLRKHSYFDTKEELVKMLGNDKAMKWNTTTISANLLLEKPLVKWAGLRIPKDKWRNVEGLPDEVWTMWELANDFKKGPEALKGKNCKLRMYDMDFVFGFGGIHGAAVGEKEFKNVMLLDVGSMYPSIAIILNVLGDATDKYDGIRKERLEIKHKDKLRSDALKLILNSVYGNLKNQYSILYNPAASSTVCVFGQMALFDLCRELYNAGYKLVNANTDGIAFIDPCPDNPIRYDRSYDVIWHEWEEKWGLYLELDTFAKWYQKDVNNYVAVYPDGKIKVKGGDVNKYHFNPEKGQHKLFSNNNIRIVHIALVEAIVYGKNPIDVLSEHMQEPELFQYVLRAGRTYQGVFDKDDNEMQRINRVFACRKPEISTKLYKKRADGGLVNFPDAPENMYVYNGDLKDFKDFGKIADFNHYLRIIRKKLDSWGVVVL